MNAADLQVAFKEGMAHERRVLAIDLMNRYSGAQLEFIDELFQKTPRTSEFLEGYAEGLRHAWNILTTADTPKNAFKHIINNKAPIDIDALFSENR